jgi:hypothetical protein
MGNETKKRDWKSEFAEAWGTTFKGLEKGTQLGVEWIDEKVVKPLEEKLDKLIEELEKKKAEK